MSYKPYTSRAVMITLSGGLLLATSTWGCRSRSSQSSVKSGNSGYEVEAKNLTPSERRGRDIWYKATAGNERYHMLPYQQRAGIAFGWAYVMNQAERDIRFDKWGAINDPDCLPGNASSFGWDICPGDLGNDGLLSFIGKEGWKDPACNLDESDVPNGQAQKRESACELRFGTSTGIMGLRKFPNPRFNANKWPGWDKFDWRDASVEPPFLVGESCGFCHIGLNPENPPSDPNHPAWANIKGLVGNAYFHVSEIQGSGVDKSSLEYQSFTHTNPGIVDTSAVPHDMVNNPGTVNAVINYSKRPPFPEILAGKNNPAFARDINRWRRVDSCNGQTECSCFKSGCWKRSIKNEVVFNILKGGEDDVGPDLAVNRVYVNIGMCAETCWLNHLTDFRSFAGRGKYQTPFDIGQCRRDCPNWRAIEDRDDDLIAFLLSARPTDLKDALGMTHDELVKSNLVGETKFEEGRQIFAKECARCHSSQKPSLPGQQADENFFLSVDFFKTDSQGVREDWLGNDELTPAFEVGTQRCRALHSNHMKGHVWEQFSSETYKQRATDSQLPELQNQGQNQAGGGRGYYRNISLLSVWAHAPFMHNNAIGPRLCDSFWEENKINCVQPDPSVQGRLKVFEESMRSLLNPDTRGKRITLTERDIVFPLGPKFWTGDTKTLLMANLSNVDKNKLKGIEIKIPKGTPVTLLASLDHKRMLDGLMTEIVAEPTVQARFTKLRSIADRIYSDKAFREQTLIKYGNCSDLIEDKGHEFGADLTPAEKEALIAFMKTL